MVDFKLVKDQIFYLQGSCDSQSYECYRLYVYNTQTGENKLLLDELNAGVNAGFSILNYEEKEGLIYLNHGGGDGPAGWMTIYSIDPKNPKLNKVTSHRYIDCDSIGGCTQEEEKENAAYEEMKKLYIVSTYYCGNTTIKMDGNTLKIKNSKQQFEFSGMFVACDLKNEKGENPLAENPENYLQLISNENKIFQDPESGIRFGVPLNTEYVDVRESGEGPDKMVSFRIQNYDPNGHQGKMGLGENEFYVELYIDYKNDSQMEDCATRIEIVEAIEGNRYMGYPNQGGDSGGERYAICFKDGPPNYYLQITENNKNHPVREMIKNSFFQE